VGNNLLAVAFDPDRLEMTGGPVPIVEGIRFQTIAPEYALSDSGTLAYIPQPTGAAALGRTLVWVDRQGKEEPLGAPPNNIYKYPKISPDGTRVAFSVYTGGSGSIWIWDLGRKALTRLTFGEGSDIAPIWTLDGKRIVFCSSTGDPGLYWKAADGAGEVERLISDPGRYFFPCSWSRDGKILLMDEGSTLTNTDIGMLSMDGDRTRKPLLKEERASEIDPMISPDGRWMAYSSNESGHHEVYVRPFPEVNKGRWQVSTGGGESPLWSPDGQELFYLSGDSAMAVAVRTEPSFSLGTPKTLFRGMYVRPGTTDGIPWDIHPDGKRFLMMKEPGPGASAGGGPRKINIVVNWLEELKQRVPVR
jgi:serine/threonine-protein kinase